MKYKFYVKEIPEPFPIWKYIIEKTNILKFYSMESKVDSSDIIKLKHEIDINSVIKAVDEMQEKFGYKGWQSQQGDSEAYGGLSLVYNPELKEEVDLNQQTLGTRTNNKDEFFWAQNQRFSSIKNTYYDSYAFRKMAPCVQETPFKDFINSFKRPLIRSRIATINSKFVPAKYQDKFGWHRDEPLFENIRINIPISTDPTFMMQVEGKNPQHLPVGNMYTWDTNLPHRAYPTSEEDRSRTHIVLGFSPWFDYDHEEDCFFSNEFYGEIHPLDMLVSGKIHEKITGVI
jgi:hypothetical protein